MPAAQTAPERAPTVAKLFASRALPEPLVPAGVEPTPDDNRALAAALKSFQQRGTSDDFSALETFLADNPRSPWRLAVQTNLGLLYYHAGYFSRCIPTFKAAWEAGKDTTDLKAKALADRAGGEYAKMLARLGRFPELKAFLEEVRDHTFTGQASELMTASNEGAASMELRPELSFRCGPLALSRILASQNSPRWADPVLENARSTMQGMSLVEVAEISKQVGLNYQVAKRAPGATLILPSVIHWKVGHFAALVRQLDGRYLSQDPTFESETWHTLPALEAEASGYFLVPSGPLPPGWTAVPDTEAQTVFGKGSTSGPVPVPVPGEPKGGGSGGSDGDNNNNGCGMAVYAFRLMMSSLEVHDTPVGYTPPYGYPVLFTATYTQRDPNQPSNFNYSNLGPKWSFGWQRFITDNPSSPASVSQATSQGAYITHSYTGSSNGYYTFAVQFDTHKQLRRPTTGLPYEVTNPDGSKEIYGQSDGSTSSPRKVFLTQLIDPAGNTTTLSYDAQLRLTTVTDALGQATTLTYGLSGDPYKITKVTDPFGRFATFAYDASGRLTQIQDVIGIQSVFAYNDATNSNFITSLTTPYGKTTFTNTETGSSRRLTATDPAGDTEVLETNWGVVDAIPFNESVAPTGLGAADQFNQYLYYRNSFHWNKKQWKQAPGDYTQAHIYHWLHDQSFSQMSAYLESEKTPLQSRIWNVYPGQSLNLAIGTQITPIAVGRAVEGGSQNAFYTYNALGLVTSVTDPLGRVTKSAYASNNTDLQTVTHTEAGGDKTLASYTYNTQHRPLTYTDAAGQVTYYTWNSTGQITSVRNAKNETTSFSYYPADASGKQRKGRLYQIDGALSGSTDVVTFDYDTAGNVVQVTGPDGYNLGFTYDNLDRLTRVTFPDGTYTETTFLALDPQTSRDRLGRLTRYVYNSIRQLVSVTDPANRTIQYQWCKCGALQQLIDAMGRITNWQYDVAGRVTTKVYADNSKVAYTYESLSGRLSAVTDEKQQVKTRAYNLDNTLAGITYTNAEHATPNVVFTYDLDYRRLKTMLDGIGTTTYAYNPIAAGTVGAGRLASVDGPLPNDTLTYAYDELGRRTGYAINGVGETRAFDPLGRLQIVTNALGSFGYTYVGATGRVNQVTYPNGMTCQYNYHPLTGDFRLKDIIHTLSGGSLLSQHSYLYNAVGNITRWTQVSPPAGLNRSWLCGYDDADQLTSVASQDPDTLAAQPTGQYAYSYDPAGNRKTETIDGVTSTATFNALNQLTGLTLGSTSILPQQTYEWDAENRLTAINYYSTGQRSEFLYNGFGRRTRMLEKQGTTISSDRTLLWQGMQLLQQRENIGQTTEKRFFGRGSFVINNGAGIAAFFARDHLGSPREVVSGGNVTNAFDYQPWGNRRSISGNDDLEVTFNSYISHPNSGSMVSPSRAYNPALGRWLSRDSILSAELLPEGPNLYSYSANSPVTLGDPSGHFAFLIPVFIEGAELGIDFYELYLLLKNIPPTPPIPSPAPAPTPKPAPIPVPAPVPQGPVCTPSSPNGGDDPDDPTDPDGSNNSDNDQSGSGKSNWEKAIEQANKVKEDNESSGGMNIGPGTTSNPSGGGRAMDTGLPRPGGGPGGPSRPR